MTLSSGARLGPFEIVTRLGAGGMGEVYEARDTRLGRTVALKILPAGLARDQERLARFEREARAVSQLSHPHVCTLHDVGEQDGLHFLVMERCEGETLADRLRRGPLELSAVLEYGAEIAEALNAAHRRNIIHRDLKPGNIMLTPAGIKLLDFGLARMAADKSDDGSGLDDLPTVARDAEEPLTAEGVVMGTYPYMAPEQVEGRSTDARSDVFALGAVLYEMATGRRAFDGKSAASVMAAVLKEEPVPVSTLQPVSPVALDHIVSRCLEKDPEDRWQSTRDVAAELRWISEAGSAAGVAFPAAKRRRSRERLAWISAGTLAVLLLALALLWGFTREPVERPVIRLGIDVPESSVLAGYAISPDGKTLAYSHWREGKSQLYLHHLKDLDPVPVLGADNASLPFFSPNGRWIGYVSKDALYKIPVTGGSPVLICKVETFTSASWNDDGNIVFSKAAPTGLWSVPDSGGTPVELTTIDLGEKEERSDSHFAPHHLPGNQGILFSSWSPGRTNEFTVTALDAESGEKKKIVNGSSPAYDPAGYLLYLDTYNDVLNAAPFDIDSLEMTGEPRVIARDVNGAVAVSDSGTLLYERSPKTSSRLVKVGAEGDRDALSLPEGDYGRISISPDGRRAAVVMDEDEVEIWIVDLQRGTSTRLTTYPGYDEFPVWSTDGEWIIFSSDRDGPPNLYRIRARGGDVERLTTARSIQRGSGFAPDGRLLFTYNDLLANGRSDSHIGLIDLQTGQIEPLLTSDAQESAAGLSPDGRWLLFYSDQSGTWELYVTSFPDLREKIRVTPDGSGGAAVWGADNRTIYYVKDDRVMAVPFIDAPQPTVGEPRELVESTGLIELDSSPDGSLIINEPSGRREQSLVAVINWTEEMRMNDER